MQGFGGRLCLPLRQVGVHGRSNAQKGRSSMRASHTGHIATTNCDVIAGIGVAAQHCVAAQSVSDDHVACRRLLLPFCQSQSASCWLSCKVVLELALASSAALQDILREVWARWRRHCAMEGPSLTLSARTCTRAGGVGKCVGSCICGRARERLDRHKSCCCKSTIGILRLRCMSPKPWCL